ncbi:hypothetical protein M408DRAFT_292567 [Serendipita vermifera MAFF 305830]|nr:hypothetical protein M408DRAFT_292567 [Serendipita vermifera MAFF 305830]
MTVRSSTGHNCLHIPLYALANLAQVRKHRTSESRCIHYALPRFWARTCSPLEADGNTEHNRLHHGAFIYLTLLLTIERSMRFRTQVMIDFKTSSGSIVVLYYPLNPPLLSNTDSVSL